MAETLKDFLVGIGFMADPSSAKKAEDAVAKTEATITKTAAEESAKRVEGEQKAASARLTIAQALGKLLLLEETKAAEAREERRKAAAEKAAKADQVELDKQQKRQEEAEKKVRDRREASLKAAQAGALRLAGFALKSIAALQATALGVVYATDKAAQAMERLGYQSRLIGSTPAAMTAAGYAASQLGSSVEGANAALTSMGLKFKTLPGYAEAFSRLTGKSAKDAQGNLRDTGELVADLGEKLREIEKAGGKYGRAQALAQAGMFGLDDQNFINAIEDPRYRQYQEEQRKRQTAIGADPNESSEAGTKFEVSMRRLRDVIDAIQIKIQTGLFKDLQPQLEKLSAWGEANGERVAGILTRIANDIVAFADAVLTKLANVDWNTILTDIEAFAKGFDALATKYFGETGSISVALAAFGLVVGSAIIKPITTALGLLGTLGRVLAAIPGLAAANPVGTTVAAIAVGGLADAEMARRTGAAMTSGDPSTKFDPETGFVNDLDFGYGDKGKGDGKANGGSKAWAWFKSLFGGQGKASEAESTDLHVRDAILSTDKGVKELVEATKHAAETRGSGGGTIPNLRYGPGGHTPGSASAGGGEGGSRSWRNNNPGNISAGKFAMAHGADGSDGRFAHFPTYEAGRRAQEDLWFNSDTYKGLTLEQAVTKWSPPGENDTAGLIRRYGIAAGIGPTTPLSRLSADQRSRLLDAQQAAEGWKVGSRTNGVSGPGSVGSGDVVGKALDMVHMPQGEVEKVFGHSIHTLAWCADFVNGMIGQNGGKGSGSAMARSFMNWGKGVDLKDVKRGDVAVLNGGGHVGFFTGERTKDGRMGVVAGNTRDGHGGHDVEHYFVDPRSVYGARRGDQPIKVDVTDKSAERIGHGIAKGAARAALGHRDDHVAAMRAVHATRIGKLFPTIHHPHGVTPSVMASIDNSRRRGDATLHYAPQFHSHGGDPRTMMADARRDASRGSADLMRNLLTTET